MPYEEIVAPPSGTEVAFGEPITVEGHAWRVARDGSKQPADTKIVWRHESGGGYAASGPNVTLTFTNRQNTNVAMYAGKSNIVDRVKLNVVCGAIEEVARTQKTPVSDDQYVLALIMVAEAGLKENPDDERAAVGATVANRWRVYGKYFSGKPSPTLREVIESTVNAIAGKDVPRYKGNVGDRNHLRATMKAGDCEIFRRALAQAKLLLETKAPITPSGCTAPPYFFNRDRNAPPELAESPLVHGKRDQGWLHSFYGWTGTPGGK